jgi:hypothetical protein
MRGALCAAALFLVACTVPDVELEGRPCPCVEGYVCDEASSTCLRASGPVDAGSDAPVLDTSVADTGASDTGASDTSTTDTMMSRDTGAGDADPGCWRDDFDSTGLPGWTVVGGDWSQASGEARQSDDEANPSFMIAGELASTRSFRATTRMRQISGASGGAMEICFRTNPADPGDQYFCNWEPNSAQMVLMRGFSDFGTMSLSELNLDLEDSPGWDPFRTFTMVLEVDGSSFRCWIEEVPGTEITAVDSSLAQGAVGLKTYRMATAYEYLEVCPFP